MDFKDIPSADFSKILGSMPPVTPQFNFSVPKIPEIDPTSTVQYKIQEQTRLLTEQSQKQIEALTGQNKQLEALIEQRDKELKQSNRAKFDSMLMPIANELLSVSFFNC